MIPSKSLLNLTHAQSPSFQPFPRSSHSSVLLVGSTFMFWKAFWTWHRTTQQSRKWRSNTSKRYDGAPCSPSAILLHPGCCPQITRITCQHETTSRLPWWMQSLWSCFACCQKHGRKTIRNKEVSCEWKCEMYLPYTTIRHHTYMHLSHGSSAFYYLCRLFRQVALLWRWHAGWHNPPKAVRVRAATLAFTQGHQIILSPYYQNTPPPPKW